MKTMKNVILMLAVFAFVSCNSEKTESKDTKSETEKTEMTDTKTEPSDTKKEPAEVDSNKPVIDQFLAMLDGTEETAEKAVKKFATKKVIANGMIPFGKNPKIDSRDGDCCVVSLNDNGDINQYSLCEENGKITVFDIYFGED